ncbi:polyamine-transporting ATPase 13A3-like isoform X2 [Mya arenaria]|uniref:polyamine-transporting ATPase 13A3-like isoform X2 n=1 Tax=Mya arenaria TaxID=6604 RepID=UPI0022DEAFF0|nr:polyamine-transporting ATPase 13A3-like isoform X2 [Mya arenaria]
MAADTDLKRQRPRNVKFAAGPPPVDPMKSYINTGDEDQMEVECFTVSRLRQYLVYCAIFGTVGLLRLLFHWLPHWYIRATHRKCSIAEATHLLLKDQYEQWFVAKVQTITKDGTRVTVLKPSASFTLSGASKRKRAQLLLNTGQKDENLIRYFEIKRVKYIWNSDEDRYQKLRGLEANSTCSYLHEARGLTFEHQRKRRVLYSSNAIDVHVSPVISLLFKEALTPFYVFQVFSVCVWYFDEYYYYATCIIFISIISLTTSIYQTRKIERALRNTIQTSTVVTVCRGDDVYQDIPSEDLVPGDVIEIPHHGTVMQCDAALISGNCIVNESMLTGESVPVTKTPLPDSKREHDVKYCLKEHARHTLFCGTQVIQTRYYGNQKVRAVILRTGFLTSKGELVRSILYPKPVDFKFNKDTYLFVAVLFLIAAIGLIYTVVLKIKLGHPVEQIIKRSLDVITIAVPPALPAALTVGIVFAQSRMKKQKIFCISPRSINICGSINAVCFDKTGTLTGDGLNMQGVVPSAGGRFNEEVTDMSQLEKSRIVDAMATCHSLTLIEGHLNGDPLDLIMFHSINWVLEEAGEENSRFDMLVPTIVYPRSAMDNLSSSDDSVDPPSHEIGIVRQLTFTSNLQRMSVIVRRSQGTQFEVYSKGSPEVISSLCKSETVPEDFHKMLRSYTQHGYRVLALAWKHLPNKYNYVKVQRVQRDKVECDLTFLGLLVMENKLKPETTPVIQQLQDANIKTVMVTGDNMLTALSVAHDCKMVLSSEKVVLVEAELVDTAEGLEPQCRFLGEKVPGLEQPLEKGRTISDIQICVDEDSSTVRFATTGRSWQVLRQFFPDILSKVLVRGVVFARMSPEQKAQLVEGLQELGEGRAALVTSFGIFKYMACYSLTQFVSVLILYHVDSNLTDFEFLYIDLALLTTLSVTYGRTEAYPSLVKEPPQLSLTSFSPICSIILQMAVQISAQVFSFLYIQKQPWFEPHVSEEEYDFMCYENAAVFSVSMFQYIILAVAFSKGAPYRKAIYTNYLFMLNLLVCFAFSSWLAVYPLDWMQDFFELQSPPSVTFRLIFFGLATVNCLLSVIFEAFLLDHEIFRRKFRQLREKCFPSLKYEYSHIEDEIISTPNWPPVGKDPIIANYRNDTNMAETSAEETEAMLPKIGSKNMCNSSTILSSASGYTPRTSLSDQPYVSMSSVATVSSDFPVSPNNADGDDATDNTFSSSNSFIDEQIKEQTASVDCDTIVSLKGIPEEIKNENQSV